MQRPLLSVNLNKYALLRNSRGRNLPSLLGAADVCLEAGGHGITLHPRMDQRHVRFDDVPDMKAHLDAHHPGVELNVEIEDHPFLVEMCLDVRPAQCTLVPVRPGEVTSDHGWDLPRQAARLAPTVRRLREAGIRVSLFMDCHPPDGIPLAAEVGADRVELYTGPYAWAYDTPHERLERKRAFEAAEAANAAGLGLNAGHDLDRHNLGGLRELPGLLEVSIGHAQICRALEVGTRQSVRELLEALGY